jgi:hypothetical protein
VPVETADGGRGGCPATEQLPRAEAAEGGRNHATDDGGTSQRQWGSRRLPEGIWPVRAARRAAVTRMAE